MEEPKGPVPSRVVVAVPHRISGFFEIVDRVLPDGAGLEDLASIGSRGGGPCLSACGTTTVRFVDGRAPGLAITINGQDATATARTTRSVVKWLAPAAIEDRAIAIDHVFPLPSGAGYGSSGAGAVGAAIGLNMLLGLGLPLNECGKFAHVAEVENKTGLGTVGGQIRGGCAITMVPGYPFGMNSIIVPPRHKIACASLGGLLTSDILRDPGIRAGIIRAGKVAMQRIAGRFTIGHFMATAIDFVEATGMLDMPALDLGAVQHVMRAVNGMRDPRVLGASMNQLGKSVYAIFKDEPGVEGRIERACLDAGFGAVRVLDFNTGGPSVALMDWT